MSQTALVPFGAPASHGISFFNPDQFAHAQRVANMFASSALVPKDYQGNVANCVLALDIAERTGTSPLMVMQNLYMIHGKPSWSSAYIIAAMNTTGKFTPLRYEMSELAALPEEMAKKAKNAVPAGMPLPTNKQCIAYAWELNIKPEDRKKENRLESAPVSVAMAIQEGWWNKTGSKWPIMTDLMLRYRAATLFGRMYAPEKLMGMPDAEEARDIIELVPEDTAKKSAVEEKLGIESGTRKRRGAASAAPEVVVSEAPAETPMTAPASEAPATPPAESPQPTSEPVVAKYRTAVEKAEEVQLPDKRLITKVQLKGDEFTGEAFYEHPLIKFAPDGAIVDVSLERRPHKSIPDKFLTVITAYEVVA